MALEAALVQICVVAGGAKGAVDEASLLASSAGSLSMSPERSRIPKPV